MTKTSCDICSKEIAPHTGFAELIANQASGIQFGGATQFVVKRMHFCWDCALFFQEALNKIIDRAKKQPPIMEAGKK